jgi:hypothetical protein
VSGRTAQELDPLGGITARVLVIAAVGVSIVVAAAMSLTTASQVSSPVLEAAALLSFTAAGLYYVRATSPFLAPFRRRSHAVVCLLALAAVVLDALARWGGNAVVRDDWAPICLAVLTITFGAYRTAGEIAAWAAVGGLVIGALALAQAESFTADVPAPVFAILAATPVLATGAAAASFSRSLVGRLREWRSGELEAAASDRPDDLEPVRRPTPAHLVHLDEEVLPFLERLVGGTRVSEADGEQARRLATRLRSLMVSDSERSWLGRLVIDVDDPAGYADRMALSERGFVRALVAHLRAGAAFDDERMRVAVIGSEWEASCVIMVPCRPGSNPRVQLAPYIAVARSVFGTVGWRIARSTLTITLAFEPTVTEEHER